MAGDSIDQWLQQVAQLLGRSKLPDELQDNLRVMTQAWLRKLDVVTREEFEAQCAVLARTRARLEALEQQIQEMENQQKP